jgi:hypothetical protein
LQELALIVREIEKYLALSISSRYIDEIDRRTGAWNTSIAGRAGDRFRIFRWSIESKLESFEAVFSAPFEVGGAGQSFVEAVRVHGCTNGGRCDASFIRECPYDHATKAVPYVSQDRIISSADARVWIRLGRMESNRHNL